MLTTLAKSPAGLLSYLAMLIVVHLEKDLSHFIRDDHSRILMVVPSGMRGIFPV